MGTYLNDVTVKTFACICYDEIKGNIIIAFESNRKMNPEKIYFCQKNVEPGYR